MQFALIIFTTIMTCVIYGILHDQITARLCIEYFTVFHAPIFGTDNPTILGIGWGILATWWVGLLLGIPLAAVCRVGKMPKRSATDLVRPLAVLMVISACIATSAGIVAAVAASNNWISMPAALAARIPKERHITFLVDLWAHSASYAAGFFGGIVLIALTWRRRLLEHYALARRPRVRDSRQ